MKQFKMTGIFIKIIFTGLPERAVLIYKVNGNAPLPNKRIKSEYVIDSNHNIEFAQTKVYVRSKN